MKRDILEQPFESHLIRSRRGHSGKVFSYVEGPEYIRRLNEAFEGEWSFEVAEYQVLENDVFVIGKLTAQGIVKTAFGGTSITRNQHTGDALNIADDLKAAATDALKKASTLFGLGLHLYSDNSGRQNESSRRSTSSQPISAMRGKLTDRQLTAIQAIARSLGWTQETLNQHCLNTFSAPPDELIKADASSLINELRQISIRAVA